MKQRVHVYYSGRVQGIGFRYTALDIARNRGITGWVRNLRDGRVEVLAEAEQEKIQNFLEDISSYFSGYIRDAETDWNPATGEFSDFTITN